MNKNTVAQKRIPIYVFLFSLYPVLAMYVINIHEAVFKVVLRPGLVCLLLSVIFFLFSILLFKNLEKAGLFALLVEILFFSYGHLYQLLEQSSSLGTILGHHRILIPGYLLILLVGFILIKKLKLKFEITNYLNILIIILILFPTIQISKSIISSRLNANKNGTVIENINYPFEKNTQKENGTTESSKPDIYYIILDSYTRNDVLLKDYGFDNSDFLSSLQNLGFYIAWCANSNYAQTRMSLSSSLNMEYIQDLDPTLTPEKTDRSLVDGLLLHNSVMEEFQKLGYKTVNIESGVSYTELKNSDIYFELPKQLFLTMPLQPFEVLFLKTTALKILTELHVTSIDDFIQKASYPYYDFIRGQQFILGKLPQTVTIQSPKFVFVHIYLPHHPFIFNPDGTYTFDDAFYRAAYEYPINDDLYRIGYINQVQFINKQILTILKEILNNSKNPPIVILQGDHGQKESSEDNERMKILEAFYFPNMQYDDIYPSITPINTFRVVLNNFFNATLSLKKDISYYSSYQTPYNFQIIPEDSSICLGK